MDFNQPPPGMPPMGNPSQEKLSNTRIIKEIGEELQNNLKDELTKMRQEI
jgi:hypothetical protein